MQLSRLAFVAACGSLASIAFASVLSNAGCSFSPDAPLPDTGFIVDDSGPQDTRSVQPSITVYFGGADIPADLSCKGAKDSGVDSGHDTAISDSGTDTAVADSGADTALDDADATVDETGDAGDAAVDATPDSPVDGGVDAPSGYVPIELTMQAFGSSNTQQLPNVDFDVFLKNTIPDGAKPDFVPRTNDKGKTTVLLPPASLFAIRVNAKDDPDPKKGLKSFWQYDILTPPTTGAIDIAGITVDEWGLLVLAVTGSKDYVFPSNKGVFATRVYDCKRRQIAGATVDIVDVDTGKFLEYGKCLDGLCRIYMSDLELPALERTWTSRSALVALANIDATGPTKHLRAIAKGKVAGSDTPQEIGTRDLEIHAGGINVMYIDP